MAIFDRLDRMVSRSVDRVNAIPFSFTPISATPNGRPGPDPARGLVNGKGIFSYLSVESGVQLGVRRSYRDANDLRSLQVGREPELSVEKSYFTDDPRQGDRIKFTGNDELPEFDVISAQPDGLSRIVLKLVKRVGAQ